MTGPDFTTALTTLGLDNHQAAQWLGVSVKSVRRYRVSGAPGPVERALQSEMEKRNLFRITSNPNVIELTKEDMDRLNRLALDWRE